MESVTAPAWQAPLTWLYKSWIVEHEGVYFLFYNAKNQAEWLWHEQTGVALSDDLVHWERYAGNPILRNGPPGAFDEWFCCTIEPDAILNRRDDHAPPNPRK